MSPPTSPRPPGNELPAVLAAALGSSLVGTVPYFALGLYKGGMDVASVLLFRYWLALVVLIPLAWATSPSLRDDWRLAGRGLWLNGLILGVAQTYTYFRAVQSIPSSIVITVFFAYPMVTLVLDRLLFGRPIHPASVFAVLVIALGAFLTGWPNLKEVTGDVVGVICVIATPLIYSIYIAIAYRFTRQASPFAGAASIYLGLGCGYLLITAVFGLKLPTMPGDWVSLFIIAIVGGVIQISSFAYALPRLSASGYSIIVSLELVTVVLIGVLALGEQLSAAQLAGIAMVAVGIVADRLLRARATG